MKLCAWLLVVLLLSALLGAQEPTTPNEWQALQFLAGAWESQVAGKAGVGTGDREYTRVLQDKFLHFKNRTVFPPQEKNPEGEIHEDWGFFSFDEGRNTCVLRQFHGEGFVNQYTLDSLSANGDTLVFITESIENIPDGWRAKLTIIRQSEDAFTELFALASPGKDFGGCIENRWTRKK